MDRPSNFLVCRFALNPGRTVVQSGSWIPFIIYESQKLLDGTRLRISKFEIADYFHSWVINESEEEIDQWERVIFDD